MLLFGYLHLNIIYVGNGMELSRNGKAVQLMELHGFPDNINFISMSFLLALLDYFGDIVQQFIKTFLMMLFYGQ